MLGGRRPKGHEQEDSDSQPAGSHVKLVSILYGTDTCRSIIRSYNLHNPWQEGCVSQYPTRPADQELNRLPVRGLLTYYA
jgi:hypothetical protein